MEKLLFIGWLSLMLLASAGRAQETFWGPTESSIPARMAELAEAAYLPRGLIPYALAPRGFVNVETVDRSVSPDAAIGSLGRTARAYCATAAGGPSPVPPGTVVVVFRGTTTANDWLTDAFVHLSPWSSGYITEGGRVHTGFLRVSRVILDSDRVMARVQAAPHLFVVGHSLGGAAAILFAAQLIDRGFPARRLSVLTYGAPRPGDAAFADALLPVLRIAEFVNGRDPVTSVPSRPFYHLYEREPTGHGVVVLRSPVDPEGANRKWVSADDHHTWQYVAALHGFDEDIRRLKMNAKPASRNEPEPASVSDGNERPRNGPLKLVVDNFLRRVVDALRGPQSPH